jgi:hypothetical protein
MNETPFLEANALLAVHSGDHARARQLTADLLPAERLELAASLAVLLGIVTGLPAPKVSFAAHLVMR